MLASGKVAGVLLLLHCGYISRRRCLFITLASSLLVRPMSGLVTYFRCHYAGSPLTVCWFCASRFDYNTISISANYLLERTKHRPAIGIVCGSGLGQFSQD